MKFIFQIIKHWSFISLISSTIFGGIVFGINSYYQNKYLNTDQSAQIKTIIINQNDTKVMIQDLKKIVDSLSIKQKETLKNQTELSASVIGLTGSFKQYLRDNEKDAQKLYDYLDKLGNVEKKKLNPILYVENLK